MKIRIISNSFLALVAGAIILYSSACRITNEEVGPEKSLHETNQARFMFYNVENLFDIEDDSLTNDEEFTPDGSNNWSWYRYDQKLTSIAKVVLNLGGWEPPALIGLCEIENRKVLEDLIYRTPLEKFGYRIIHQDSPDARGIDVALLYRKDIFTPLGTRWIKLTFPDEPNTKTREVLYSTGLIGGDTLHVFINHWPSRRGGQAESESKRMIAAQTVRMVVDSLFLRNPDAKIIITGDFNDGPDDKSILEGLGASPSTIISPAQLFNAMYGMKMKGLGSHKYQQEWNTLDQFIYSASLLDTSASVYIVPADVHIFETEWLLEDDPFNPGKKPLRTYAGPRYLGGYSDHLPIYLDLTFNR